MQFKRHFILAACVAAFAAPLHAQTEITVGVLTDMSGLYSDFSGKGSVAAAQLAIDDFVASHPDVKVDLVSADHQNKPDIAAATAREWYDQRGVDVIVDVTSSAAALAVSAITAEKNKVFMASNAATNSLTGDKCTPNTVHWTYDAWGLSHGTVGATLREGGDSWFLIVADYAYGHNIREIAHKLIADNGGEVKGEVLHPLNSSDFSSFVLQAQSSGAKVVGLLNGGGDTINSIKQAGEFGLVQGGQQLAAMAMFLTDVKALGLEVAQGLTLTTWFYWDLNDKTRAFSQRFAEKMDGAMPTMGQAGDYSATILYLESALAAGSVDDGAAVVAAMRDKGTYEDDLFGETAVRIDGRATHPTYLARVKSPEESKGEWDFYEIVATIPPAESNRTLEESKAAGCTLVP
ncbi:ABC transporter substrate-binding protein [Sulfitobacter sp. PR48]|uniref:ABC transporter substrate-binding protein n=1 Tax=Sulfitobacter sp. PR48 TaxID=3028383 RepID=UPI00237C3F0D|nr:ABC transporter substrate-binding protein [Sulfitobacter sp. PR48]MDD9723608.1 ABC transporter substrate-binding protein [Sulfitobacter sp. PR48]